MAGTSDATKYSSSPVPDDQRRLVACGYDLVRVRPRDDRQRERAGEFVDGLAHRLFQIAVEMAFHQVRDYFGVGFGGESVSLGLQAMLELEVVLDDAVMDHHHVAMAIAMRMGVLFGGPAVGSPARMADAERAIHRAKPDGIFQVAQFAFGATNGELLVVADRPRCRPNRNRDIPAVSALPE